MALVEEKAFCRCACRADLLVGTRPRKRACVNDTVETVLRDDARNTASVMVRRRVNVCTSRSMCCMCHLLCVVQN
jgi:hypothetical protein